MSEKKVDAGLIALIAKLGPKLAATMVKLIKGLKIGKLGLATASFASYAYLFTWEFAIMIILQLVIHESGHVWAMKKCGMETKGMYLIPFMGAVAVYEEAFPSRNAETYIAIMGPIWGFITALLTALVYLITHNPFFGAAAGWMAMVNLFNLFPINPLDGGRIIKSIAFSINSRMGFLLLVAGLIICAFVVLKFKVALFALLLLVGAVDLLFDYKNFNKKIESEKSSEIKYLRYLKTRMNAKSIILYITLYIALAILLWTMISTMNHIPEVETARQVFM